MEQSPFRKPYSCSAGQEIRRPLWIPVVVLVVVVHVHGVSLSLNSCHERVCCSSFRSTCKDTVKLKNLEKSLFSATLSTDITWNEPGANPGLRGGRPVANRLNHGTT
jgi:hypothetical protein